VICICDSLATEQLLDSVDPDASFSFFEDLSAGYTGAFSVLDRLGHPNDNRRPHVCDTETASNSLTTTRPTYSNPALESFSEESFLEPVTAGLRVGRVGTPGAPFDT